MKKRIILGVVLALVLVVFIGFIYFKNPSGITGKVVGENVVRENDAYDGVEKYEMSCNDSDNGKKFFVKGVIDYCDTAGKCISEEDFCVGKKLTEGYCDQDEKKYEEYECDFDCDDGSCIELVKKYSYSYKVGGSNFGESSSPESSGESVVVETGQIYDLGELTSENTLEIVKDDEIRFSISNEAYVFVLEGQTGTQVVIDYGLSRTLNLFVGDELELDINNDGILDISVRLRSINVITGKIKLTLRRV